MPAVKSPTPSLDGLLNPASPPAPPPPTQPEVKPVLVTEQQLEGEIGNLVQPKGQASRRRLSRFFLGIILLAALGGAAYWGIQRYRQTSATVADTTADDPFASNAPSLEADASTETAATAPDLTTASGRDTARRARLNLFTAAAKAATAQGVVLPSTDHVVPLSDLSNPAVTALRQTLADQGLSSDQIDGYLIDPSADSYYFGYQFDGQILTLTAVLEDAATDCVLTPTTKGDLCILTTSTAL